MWYLRNAAVYLKNNFTCDSSRAKFELQSVLIFRPQQFLANRYSLWVQFKFQSNFYRHSVLLLACYAMPITTLYLFQHRIMDTNLFQILNHTDIENQLETIVDVILELMVIQTLLYLCNKFSICQLVIQLLNNLSYVLLIHCQLLMSSWMFQKYI